MGSKQHPNPPQKMDQNRPGRPGVDDAQKANPSRQASRTEPSHQKDMQDRQASQKDRMAPKH
ncbi:hypothetical protein D3C81_1161100 [compost metagenome]|uniref:Uncharacterized protein n=1 Tax=Stenotrophomonas humi TaxID=405444 RepID=A0A0R0BZF9_9GAMM|nr:hypothetical protein [Stenotrophomonas humi]KRG62773.1 hypothetical protein ABB26_14995 [Stenotrophomonas humi]